MPSDIRNGHEIKYFPFIGGNTQNCHPSVTTLITGHVCFGRVVCPSWWFRWDAHIARVDLTHITVGIQHESIHPSKPHHPLSRGIINFDWKFSEKETLPSPRIDRRPSSNHRTKKKPEWKEAIAQKNRRRAEANIFHLHEIRDLLNNCCRYL